MHRVAAMPAMRVAVVLGIMSASLLAGCTDADGPLPHASGIAGDGCTDPAGRGTGSRAVAWLPGARATSPSAPLTVRLAVCDPEAFHGSGSEVVLSLATPYPEAREVSAGVALPPGVVRVSGSHDHQGRLDEAGSPLRLRAVLRAEAPGEVALRGWAELPAWASNGSRAAVRDVVGVRGDASTAETFAVDCAPRPAPAATHPAACGLPPDALRVALRTEPGNDSRVVALVETDRALEAQAMFWTGADFEDGWRVLRLSLEPGRPQEFRASVRFPEDWLGGAHGGTYEVWFHVYPHASVENRITSEALHYTVEDGEPRAHPGPSPP